MQAGPAQSRTEAKRIIATCVKQTAAQLGNTPAVCRKAYVHPGVFEVYDAGRLDELFVVKGRADPERALLKFLDRMAEG